MPSLHELELAFVRAMFDATDRAAEAFVCAHGMASAARLAIYRNDIMPVDLAAGAVRLLIRRRGDAVEIESVGTAEFALLAAFARGVPLQNALMPAYAADARFDFEAFLIKRASDATLVGFVVATNVSRTIGPATSPGLRVV